MKYRKRIYYTDSRGAKRRFERMEETTFRPRGTVHIGVITGSVLQEISAC